MKFFLYSLIYIGSFFSMAVLLADAYYCWNEFRRVGWTAFYLFCALAIWGLVYLSFS